MRDAPFALLCVVASGCSYDWSAGPSDASRDALADTTASDQVAQDAAPESDAPGTDATADVTQDGPTCEQLEAQVQQALAGALPCTPGTTACMTEVNDPCGCPVVVATATTSPATQSYVNAVAQLKAACSMAMIGCSGSCGTAPTKGLCIVGDAAGVYACSQD